MLVKVAVLLALVVGCAAQQPPETKDLATPQPYTDRDAYEVYAALLPEEWPLRVAHAQTVVIREQTKPPFYDCEYTGELAKKLAPIIADFKRVNKQTWQLQRAFPVDFFYELVPGDEIEGYFKNRNVDGWQQFSSRHPQSKGFITVSAVGFNADKTIAMVYMDHHCGSLCGGGGVHVLEKVNGKWQRPKWFAPCGGWMS